MALPLCGHTGRLGAINDRTDDPRTHVWASGNHRDGGAGFRADGYNSTHDGRPTGHLPAGPQPVASSRRPPCRTSDEIIVTAQKREENLQNVPISIQALGTRRLDQLNISNFNDYTKLLPSVASRPRSRASTTVYMRGVASGGDGNHSGSLPSVGVYLDEQPVTTIGGTLDVHIYDIARIESLAGPQGTLYGASTEAGTIRIITNKPDLGVLPRPRRRRGQHRRARRHGRQAGGHDQPARSATASRSAWSASTSATPAISTMSPARAMLTG